MELNEIMELFEKHEAQEYARGFDVGKGYGYKKGYDAGLDKIQERVGYRHGLDDAIDTVKWLFRNVPDKELFEGNYVEDILNLYPWEYIRAKIKEYEQTADEIKAEYDEETRSYSYTVKGKAE